MPLTVPAISRSRLPLTRDWWRGWISGWLAVVAVVSGCRFLVPRGCRLRLLAATLAAAATAAEPSFAPYEPKLVPTTLVLAPTSAQLDTVPAFAPAWWLVPGLARDLGATLAAANFSPELAQRLHEAVRPQPDGSGLITPDAGWLDGFTPVERQRWHALLGLHVENRTYRWPVLVPTAVLDRLEGEDRFRGLVQRMRRWGVRQEDRLRFADLFALEDAFQTVTVRRDFLRAIITTDTLFLKLDVGATGEEIARWTSYWHVQGRYRAVQPFYNAVLRVQDHDRIDLTHILPQFARGLLHTFPPDFSAAPDLARESGLLAWGFFSQGPPEPAVLDEGFSAWLHRECVPVDGPAQFGDIVVFEDPERTRWPYAAVYIADDLVLSRQPTLFGPWGFMRRGEVARLNPRLGAHPPGVYRRRSTQLEDMEPPFRSGPLPAEWTAPAVLRTGQEGPWGRLASYDVLLAPPGDMLERLPEPQRTPVWTLLIDDPAALDADLSAMDMPAPVRRGLRQLLAGAGLAPGRPVTIRPPLDLVHGIPGPVRARLFRHLVTGGDSYAQTLRIASPLPPEQWFPSEALAEPLRSTLIGLTYPQGRGFALSDYGALFAALPPDREERLTALRAVFRTPALVVLLEKPTPEEVPALAAYWRLDQQKSVLALLESFAASGEGRYLDIVHLLTPLARELLNLYVLADGDAPAASCYWTALNFEADQPDPRLLVLPSAYGTQSAFAQEKLRDEYEQVDGPGRFGDIVAYRERAGRRDLLHVCAYIADDIVFTKNGIGVMAPWCLMRLENVDALYLDDASVERVAYRRKP